MKCLVKSCGRTRRDRDPSDANRLTFHRVPAKEPLRSRWLNALGLCSDSVTDADRVCSEHFSAECYIAWELAMRLGFQRKPKWLCSESVPTLHLIAEDKRRRLGDPGTPATREGHVRADQHFEDTIVLSAQDLAAGTIEVVSAEEEEVTQALCCFVHSEEDLAASTSDVLSDEEEVTEALCCSELQLTASTGDVYSLRTMASADHTYSSFKIHHESKGTQVNFCMKESKKTQTDPWQPTPVLPCAMQSRFIDRGAGNCVIESCSIHRGAMTCTTECKPYSCDDAPPLLRDNRNK